MSDRRAGTGIETRYAKSGDVHIAYQRFGRGPVTCVGVPPLFSNIELLWEDPNAAKFMRGLGSFCDYITFDKRGTGMSDRDRAPDTLEERIDDFCAVLDAEGIERAVIGGVSEGGPTAALFAATYPERVRGLVLIDSFARLTRADDYPQGIPAGEFAKMRARWVDSFGAPSTLTIPMFVPGRMGDPAYAAWVNRYERQSASPGTLRQLLNMIAEIDTRAVLPSIQAPTLVLHRTGDRAISIEHGRYLAARIPGARLIELPGDAHLPWEGDADTILDYIEEFVTGDAPRRSVERVLATVVFTDIVGSTERAAELGDRRWSELLDRVDRVTARQAAAHRGDVIKSTGDGHLVTFDSPLRALRCTAAMRDELAGLDVAIRAGVHTGEIERRGDDVGGLGVHVAARISSLAGSGEILVSRTVKDLVLGSGLQFADRGVHVLKGVPDEWSLLALD